MKNETENITASRTRGSGLLMGAFRRATRVGITWCWITIHTNFDGYKIAVIPDLA